MILLIKLYHIRLQHKSLFNEIIEQRFLKYATTSNTHKSEYFPQTILKMS